MYVSDLPSKDELADAFNQASLNLGAFCNIAIYLAVKLEGSGKSHDGEQERKDLHFKINPFSVTKITVPATI